MKIKTFAILHTVTKNLVTFEDLIDYGDINRSYLDDGLIQDDKRLLVSDQEYLTNLLNDAKDMHKQGDNPYNELNNSLGDPNLLQVVEITIEYF